MYANYNRSDYSNETDLRALALKAHGIDSSRSVCADLLNKPCNYYAAPCTNYDGYRGCISRIKFQETSSTIFNSSDTDPQIKSALVHRIILENVSGLIDDTDRKFLSYICYAIVRGDIDALTKLLNGVVRSIPHKLSAYVTTLNEHFTNLKAGICFSFHGKDMIVLHIYHGDCAIAINPSTTSVAVLPIFTDWDGTVFFADGEVLSPKSNDLLVDIQQQCIRRILMNHEDQNGKTPSSLPVVHECAENVKDLLSSTAGLAA